MSIPHYLLSIYNLYRNVYTVLSIIYLLFIYNLYRIIYYLFIIYTAISIIYL